MSKDNPFPLQPTEGARLLVATYKPDEGRVLFRTDDYRIEPSEHEGWSELVLVQDRDVRP